MALFPHESEIKAEQVQIRVLFLFCFVFFYIFLIHHKVINKHVEKTVGRRKQTDSKLNTSLIFDL